MYDKLNRLTSLKNYDAAGNLLDSYVYSYDANSNVTSIVTNTGTIGYQYDALNQLTQETDVNVSFNISPGMLANLGIGAVIGGYAGGIGWLSKSIWSGYYVV